MMCEIHVEEREEYVKFGAEREKRREVRKVYTQVGGVLYTV
jgi:hypothetical protein